VGFEPRAVRLDIGSMRAAGAYDSQWSQYSDALGKFRMLWKRHLLRRQKALL